MSTGLRDELFVLKGKLEMLEKELTDQMMELEVKANSWAEKDEEAEKIVKTNNHVVSLDVGGKKFQTKVDTFLAIKDTLFYKMVLDKKIDLKKEIFIDRSNDYFHYILSFLRNKKINISDIDSKSLKGLREEAEFYEITDLLANIDEALSEVFFTSFEINGRYSTAGTQNIEDLNDHEDKTLMKGICATSPGRITLTLNREVEFDEMEIAGWAGNTGIWATSNGSNSRILTSIDNSTWVHVGNTGNSYTTINKVKLTKSKAKYIKFEGNSYLGIGYCKILKCD